MITPGWCPRFCGPTSCPWSLRRSRRSLARPRTLNPLRPTVSRGSTRAWARSYAVHDTALAQALFAADLDVVADSATWIRAVPSAGR